MKKIGIVLFFCFCFVVTQAQETGILIRNYLPKEYGAFNQVWCSVEDRTGAMWFGTSTHVVRYDGVSWTKILIQEGKAIRSLYEGSDGVIYVGAIGNFGYIRQKTSGEFEFVSLVKNLPENEKSFSDVWKIFEVNGEIIFQPSERVYFFKDKKRVASLTPEHTFALSFYCNDRLFIRQRKIGLMEIRNHSLIPVAGGEQFANRRVLNILPEDPKQKNGPMLILEGDSGFYRMEGNRIYKSAFKSNAFLANSFPLCASWIGDSLIAVGSMNGSMFYRADGTLVEQLNSKNGLLDNSISSIRSDRNHFVWITTSQGITKIDLGSSARYYTNIKDVGGEPSTIVEFNQQIYFGTANGIFQFSDSGSHFIPIPINLREVWKIRATDNYMYAATAEGVFQIAKNYTTKKISTAYAQDILIQDSLMWIGERDGITILRKTNDEQWETELSKEIKGEQFMELQIDPHAPNAKTGIWCLGRNSGMAYRFLYDEKQIKQTTYDSSRGLNGSIKGILIIRNVIYIYLSNQTLVYQPEKDQNKKGICFALALDRYMDNPDKRLFMRGVFNGNVFSYDPTSSITSSRYYRLYGYDYVQKDYFKYDLPISGLSHDDYITSFRDSKGQFWVSGLGILIRINDRDSVLPAMRTNPYLRMLSGTKDSILLQGMFANYTYSTAIPYTLNDIRVKFTAPYFNHEELTQYRYWLEGYDETWSSWSTKAEHTFGNLPEGDYVFRLQAVNLFGQLSPESTFRFTILPPWYRTIWAYLLYVVAAIAFIAVIVYFSLLRLRKQKNRLEKIVRDRTAEVQQQKEKLQQVVGDLHDSINYAKRIQDALLPRRSHYDQYLPQSFVFLSPKDIVSGDFHWLDVKDNAVYIAAADCTGHGVPGALMSVVGFNLLDQALHEAKLMEPSKILSHLDHGVNKLLRQSDRDSEVKDGMDIAVCRIDFEQMELQYAGAFNPLYWIRNGDLFQFKADKDPIGSNENNVADHYTNHKIKIEKNDMIYIFSDGFADQFGGPFGKKFKYAPFRELLLSVHQLPLEEQHEKIKEAFFAWKKEYEQVDDVLVIGIRI
jgi:serine phosphatase RsbU (regulator of sigma subunit)